MLRSSPRRCACVFLVANFFMHMGLSFYAQFTIPKAFEDTILYPHSKTCECTVNMRTSSLRSYEASQSCRGKREHIVILATLQKINKFEMVCQILVKMHRLMYNVNS